jgi:AcrR family transcriptional regulator
MTEKQNQILEAALHLFSDEGYHATSTSKVAKKAHVSEGLIFRHFNNKQGLLDAILEEGKRRLKILVLPMANEDNPRQVIKKTLNLPFEINETDYAYWKLLFKLKGTQHYDDREQMKPLEQALTMAFTKLRYRKPELETQSLILHLDGLLMSILNKTVKNELEFKEFLMNKYHIDV